jgi:hypothetical protein
LPVAWLETQAYDVLMGKRRPNLTAKRIFTNQTFRDLYRTDTLAVDQGLRIVSLGRPPTRPAQGQDSDLQSRHPRGSGIPAEAGKCLDGKNPWGSFSTYIDSAEEIQDLAAPLGEFFPRLASYSRSTPAG